MNDAVLAFVRRHFIAAGDPLVVEVGAGNVNGGVPRSGRWVAVDISRGAGVTLQCDGHRLALRDAVADVVISTEMLEHAVDWHQVLGEMRRVLRPGGTLLLTTRSPGFPYHGYPWDFWRFTPADMSAIFPGAVVESDPLEPGVFVRTQGPFPKERRPVFSVVARRAVTRVRPWDYLAFGLWAVRRAAAHAVRRVTRGARRTAA